MTQGLGREEAELEGALHGENEAIPVLQDSV
jgi:hypothetical protein